MGVHPQASRMVAQLAEALRLLAEAPAVQREWLARYLRDGAARSEANFSVEELALQFEDAAQALPQFVQDGLLLPEQARAVAAVTEQLSSMRDASRSHLWRTAALDTHAAWLSVRRLAAQALATLPALPPG